MNTLEEYRGKKRALYTSEQFKIRLQHIPSCVPNLSAVHIITEFQLDGNMRDSLKNNIKSLKLMLYLSFDMVGKLTNDACEFVFPRLFICNFLSIFGKNH